MDFDAVARKIIETHSEATSIGRERAVTDVAAELLAVYEAGQAEMRERAAYKAWRVCGLDIYVKAAGLEKVISAEIRQLPTGPKPPSVP